MGDRNQHQPTRTNKDIIRRLTFCSFRFIPAGVLAQNQHSPYEQPLEAGGRTFGLGTDDVVSTLEVEWPCGLKQKFTNVSKKSVSTPEIESHRRPAAAGEVDQQTEHLALSNNEKGTT
jgi:hypothetical protein